MSQILNAIAADPNISPAFKASVCVGVRFSVRPLVGWGPDGSTLYYVEDTTLDEPERVLTSFSDHPRMSGADARRWAEETCAELNAGTLDPEDAA